MNIITLAQKYINKSIFSRKPDQIEVKTSYKKKKTLQEVIENLSTQDYENFLWLSILKPNEKFNIHTLKILRGINHRESQICLNNLGHYGLITERNISGEYSFNESLREFAHILITSSNNNRFHIKRLGIRWEDAHQKLVLSVLKRAYKSNFQQDIYFSKNIPWHLTEAKWTDQIHSIISRQFSLREWPVMVKDIIFAPHFANLETLNYAIAEAQENFHHAPEENLVLLCKYQLMQNSIKAALQHIPAQWIQELIEAKILHLDIAIKHIRSQSNPEDIASSIHTLQSLFTAGEFEEVLQLIQQIRSEKDKISAIRSIFPRLTVSQKDQVLDWIEALKQESYQTMVLSAILPDIPLQLMRRVLKLVAQLDDEESQATILEELIRYENKPLIKQAVELSTDITDLTLRFKLLVQACEYFPRLKKQVKTLSREIQDGYLKITGIWNTLEPSEQDREKILELLSTCPSDLDKTLFLIDRAQEANLSQLDDIWAIAMSFKDESESVWGNTVLGLIPILESPQVNYLVQLLPHLKNEELKGEICTQLLPFINTQQERKNLFQHIIKIQDSSCKAKYLGQFINDYFPAKQELLKLLHQLKPSIETLEASMALIPHEPSLVPGILDNIAALPSDSLKGNLISQLIYDIPNAAIPRVLDLIIQMKDDPHRKHLLSLMTPRLDISEMIDAIKNIITQGFPVELYQNTAKQIHRTYWESHHKHIATETIEHILPQLSSNKTPPFAPASEVLEDVLKLPPSSHRSHMISVSLVNIPGGSLTSSTLLKVLESYSEGQPHDLLTNLPIFVQSVAKVFGSKSLPAYGNLCTQLSHPLQLAEQLKPQNIEHICHKSPSQAPLPKTA